MFQSNIGKTNNSIHGCTNVMRHIIQKRAFCRIGRLCHHAQPIQLLVRLLLHLHHLTASLHSDKTNDRQKQHQCHS